MDNQEMKTLRQHLLATKEENSFLRLALAYAIGDGMLVMPDVMRDPPRFTLQQSADGLCIGLAQGGYDGTLTSADALL